VLSLFFGFARKKYNLMLQKIGRTTTYFPILVYQVGNAVVVRGSMCVPVDPVVFVVRVQCGSVDQISDQIDAGARWRLNLAKLNPNANTSI
jgi:hypothetical protein